MNRWSRPLVLAKQVLSQPSDAHTFNSMIVIDFTTCFLEKCSC